MLQYDALTFGWTQRKVTGQENHGFEHTPGEWNANLVVLENPEIPGHAGLFDKLLGCILPGRVMQWRGPAHEPQDAHTRKRQAAQQERRTG